MVLSGSITLAAAAGHWSVDRPDAPAIVEDDRTCTWRDLAAWAAAIARVAGSAAADAGAAETEPIVAVEPPNSIERL